MAEYEAVDPLRFKELDVVSFTKYLVYGGDSGVGEQGFRIGSAAKMGYVSDWFRNVNGNTGVMELQPGQVNWGGVNSQTMPGAVRMWIYHTLAGNNRFVCCYRFRQPLTGSEQYHYGIMQTDGVSESLSGKEFVQFNREIKTLRTKYDPNAQIPLQYAARKTAILYSPDSRWNMTQQPQTNKWSYMSHVLKYYNILQSFAAPIDIIDDSHDFSAYPVMIVPAYQLIDKKLIERWKKYAEKGGHLVVTCRTGQKNREGHLWNEKLSAPIYELIGAKELFFDVLPGNHLAHVRAEGTTYEWSTWADVIEPASHAETWATYDDQFYKGKASVITRKIGKGTVTYIGTDSSNGKLETQILNKVYQRAGIEIESLPQGLILQWRHGFWIALNYSSETHTVEIPQNAELIIGSPQIKPADVVVWKEH